jgi:2-methylcitrate dehydratase PrpD
MRAIGSFIGAGIGELNEDIMLDFLGGNPRATIIGRGGKTSLPNAALANGYLGHLEDYDDTHIPID